MAEVIIIALRKGHGLRCHSAVTDVALPAVPTMPDFTKCLSNADELALMMADSVKFAAASAKPSIYPKKRTDLFADLAIPAAVAFLTGQEYADYDGLIAVPSTDHRVKEQHV